MKRIAFEVKSYYGRNLAYPVDPEAFLFLHISKTKTLIPADIGTLRELGFIWVLIAALSCVLAASTTNLWLSLLFIISAILCYRFDQ